MLPSLIIASVQNPLLWLGVFLVIFLVFGHKLPEVARSLGSSVKEFKKGVKEGEEESNKTDVH